MAISIGGMWLPLSSRQLQSGAFKSWVVATLNVRSSIGHWQRQVVSTRRKKADGDGGNVRSVEPLDAGVELGIKSCGQKIFFQATEIQLIDMCAGR